MKALKTFDSLFILLWYNVQLFTFKTTLFTEHTSWSWLGSCLMLTHWLGRMRLLLLLVSSLVAAGSAELTVIEEDGWRQLLKGEWMVEL